ncbi:MAG: heme NO-binding domain-containing protein [Agarilytica sp.]
MKGVIFTSLADMIESQYGLSFWNQLLELCPLSTGGAYTASGIYPDSEIMCLVSALSQKLEVPQEFLLNAFGEYLFSTLADLHPYFVTHHSNPVSFLITVENVIHADVEKLYPQTHFPFLDFVQKSENELTLQYHSARQLCALAEGLIKGVAKYFKQEVAIIHSNCMLRGDDHCLMEISFYDRD